MARPSDDTVLPIDEALDWQADFCRGQDAPVAAAMLDAVRTGRQPGGPLVALLPESVRFGDLVPLRILAALHRLALERQAPGLALHLPTVGGTSPFLARNRSRALVALEQAVVAALAAHPEVLADELGRVPQTNEAGRSRALRVALRRMRGPVRLFELGASAGLNLRADRLPFDPADEEPGPLPEVVERRGCDLSPIDPTTPEGRTRLSSYVWVDHTDRFETLRRALDVARTVPATVEAADAADFAAGLAAVPGTTTVVWHSAVWWYLPEATRAGVLAAVEALGAQAGPDRPVWHVAWEQPEGSGDFALTVRVWDGTDAAPAQRILATGSPHGRELTIR
ncbi:MAG: DUF2332 domain-containing protein [Acidimicrobiales bacterium]|nr:DUF2332 domain-containing protein [Acidimicrobiales bacterium]